MILLISVLTHAVVVTGGSSSYSFTVENCTANPMTDLTCNASTIRYECDFGNVAFIDFVQYRIEGSILTATQNSTKPSQFYLYYNKPQDTSSTNEPLTFDRQTITDVDGNSVNANQFVEINKTCETCEATFTNTPIDYCQTDNLQLYQFTSSNSTCQPSYQANLTCDYCSPYLLENTTACEIDNMQTTTYLDLNFNTCCQVTNITEDCPTLYYPYDQATISTCEYAPETFTCNVDENPVLNDKINLNCFLSDPEPASCIINIYQNQSLLQTSPEYKSKTGTVFLPTDVETRTSFTTENGVLNAYYTKKELRPKTNYTLDVICSTETTSYQNQYIINPEYHTIDEPTHRAVWAKENAGFVITGIIALLATALFVGYLYRKYKRGWN